MTNSANIMHSGLAMGGGHCAQSSSLSAPLHEKMSFERILSRYGKLEPESRDLLSCLKLKSVELKRNQNLSSLYQGGADIFLVKEGWVSLCLSAKNRGHDVCNVFMPGDIVGLRESFFDNYDITLMALQNCRLEKVSAEEFHNVFNEYLDIKRAAVSYIMVNDNIAIERLRNCTHHKAEERVAHFLLEIYARYKFHGVIDSNVFSFPITQDVVGELLGITNVHVSRCMTVLEQKKLIRKTRSTVKLLQPEFLAEYTGFDESLIYGHLKVF